MNRLRGIALALAPIVALIVALDAVSVSAAQGQMQVAELQCTGDAELVVIENAGDAAEDLAGWRLTSDPEASETFELSVLGSVPPQAEVFIQSGPGAGGAFIWSTDFIFRDDDPSDYVRLVDASGAVIQQVNCAEATPEPTPSPSPEPSPASEVPEGGGPPPVDGGTLSAMTLIVVGGSAAAVGLATAALPFLRRAAAPVEDKRPAMRAPVAADSGGGVARLGVGLAAMALVALVAFVLLGRRRS